MGQYETGNPTTPIAAPAPREFNVPPDATLDPARFDEQIWKNGVNVFHESGVACPCRQNQSSAAQTGCKSCGGVGYFYTNRRMTRMAIQHIGFRQLLKPEGIFQVGDASVTAMAHERLCIWDRIFVSDITGVHTEALQTKFISGEKTAFAVYWPTKILQAWLFDSVKTRHIELTTEGVNPQVTISGQRFIFSGFNGVQISVKYEYIMVYYIMEIDREISKTRPMDCQNADGLEKLTVHGLGRRAANMRLDYQNTDGTGLFDYSEGTGPNPCILENTRV